MRGMAYDEFGDDELHKAGAVAIYDTPSDLAKALGDTPLA